jgi:glycosyltransferase involved in cell wall biosynthesis
MASKRVYFLVPYPRGEAPSQRFRFEQYFEILTAAGIDYRVSPFLSDKAWHLLYKPGHVLHKVMGILAGLGRRVADLFKLYKCDYVFIHREAAPLGPPILEWIIARVLHKRVIYDFDDAIWLANTSSNNRIAAGLKWHSKVKAICKWSHKVSCGNAYLADFARVYNRSVVINPTTIDTNDHHNEIKDQHTPTLTIGWTGTHSTAKYLDHIIHILEELEQQYTFTFVMISNAKPKFHLKSLQYIHWSKATEIADLMQFNIGLMPLVDDIWAQGKCGFKALQYMSLGIPALVSPVGVNTQIVDAGINGMVCTTDDDWRNAIAKFLTDAELRVEMGIAARQKVETVYSVQSNTANFLGLFK